MEELRRDILIAESKARRLAYDWDNRYANAHLKEVSLLMQLATIQLDYADLAHEGLSS